MKCVTSCLQNDPAVLTVSLTFPQRGERGRGGGGRLCGWWKWLPEVRLMNLSHLIKTVTLQWCNNEQNKAQMIHMQLGVMWGGGGARGALPEREATGLGGKCRCQKQSWANSERKWWWRSKWIGSLRYWSALNFILQHCAGINQASWEQPKSSTWVRTFIWFILSCTGYSCRYTVKEAATDQQQ